jgi:hypothetical protein
MNSANIIQAARGPILLITVGVLMAIDYNTPFGFSHTWPILVIVFGILKLLERVAAPPQPPVYTPPVPPGFTPDPSYQAPAGSYAGSTYQPAPGYPQTPVPPQGPGGNPQ